MLANSHVTETGPSRSMLTRQIHDPLTYTFGYIKELIDVQLFVGFQEGLTNKARPDNNRLMSRVTPTSTRKIKMVSPTVLLVSKGLVTIKPSKALQSFLFVSVFFGYLIHNEITTCHVPSSLSRFLRLNP